MSAASDFFAPQKAKKAPDINLTEKFSADLYRAWETPINHTLAMREMSVEKQCEYFEKHNLESIMVDEDDL